MELDTLFLAFANQQQHHLPTLQEEDDALYKLLSPRARDQHFLLHRDSYTTLEKLPAYLTLYRDSLTLFMFSGHAGRDRLLLADGVAGSEGIAHMLGQCPRLKLVMLNGCSTNGQVGALLQNGIPVVVATSAPMSDRKATYFSIRFFDGLANQFSIREAFEMAKGATEAAFAGVKMAIHPGIAAQLANSPEPAWGLFYEEKNAHVLDWKLPAQAAAGASIALSDDFTPNQQLIDVLFEALAAYNDEIRKLQSQAARGMSVGVPKKRMAVLNALPAPLAEPLRKLMVPVEQENEGYDKVSEARLRQIVQAYSATMELLLFTMLAQWWEACDTQPGLKMSAQEQEAILRLLQRSSNDTSPQRLPELIQTLKGLFDRNHIGYFMPELEEVTRLFREDEAFKTALVLLDSLQVQVKGQSLDRNAIPYLSRQGEDALAQLYAKMGFMARYRLATIQGIDVEKYRHKREATFNHATVMLHDLLGGFEVSEVHLDRFLDNRSILLLNEETWAFLNLSPFVIDENAFHERAEICKLYFFSHGAPGAGVLFYKYANKPDDPPLEISDKRMALVKEQFDAFRNLITKTPLATV